MRFPFPGLLLVALTLGAGPLFDTPRDPLTLFEFDSDSEARWQVVNDGVMGGRSEGFVAIRDGALVFDGNLVTRGGGFTSVRATREVNLEGFDGIELRVRGGGRTFEIEVDDDTRRGWRSVSRRAAFATSEEWTDVRVPFSTLGTTVFGQRVTAPPIDLAGVKRIGLYIADGKDGPFRLEVDVIRAYTNGVE